MKKSRKNFSMKKVHDKKTASRQIFLKQPDEDVNSEVIAIPELDLL